MHCAFRPQGYSETGSGVDFVGCSASGVYIMNISCVTKDPIAPHSLGLDLGIRLIVDAVMSRKFMIGSSECNRSRTLLSRGLQEEHIASLLESGASSDLHGA